MENLVLKFQGFHPSNFARDYLSEKMHIIHDEAPYGANLNATFTRRKHLFKGVVSIHSSAGQFFATASGTQLKEVTHKLVERIRRQLDKWRSHRFQHESLRDIALKDIDSTILDPQNKISPLIANQCEEKNGSAFKSM